MQEEVWRMEFHRDFFAQVMDWYLEEHHKRYYNTSTYEVVVLDCFTGNIALLKQNVLKKQGIRKAIVDFVNGNFNNQIVYKKGERIYADLFSKILSE